MHAFIQYLDKGRNWILDAGNWVLDTGSWIPEVVRIVGVQHQPCSAPTMKAFGLIALLFLQAFLAAVQNLDTLFKTVKYRNIGPFRGGRSNCGTGVVGDPLSYYMCNYGRGSFENGGCRSNVEKYF